MKHFSFPYSFIGVLLLLAASHTTTTRAESFSAVASVGTLSGLVMDHHGVLYTVEGNDGVIHKVYPWGEVQLLAGTKYSYGSADGTGAEASFSYPQGACVDDQDNLYIADTNNHLIRKITPEGVVTTISGVAKQAGSTDGAFGTALFNHPSGLAIDSDRTLYVADSDNHTIRKIAPDGTVSTLAGLATITGSTDGNGSDARFDTPLSIVLAPNGLLYVTDDRNSTIRAIDKSGVVSTFVGSPGQSGYINGKGTHARLSFPTSLAVNSAGDLFVVDNNQVRVRKISPSGLVSNYAGNPSVPGPSTGPLENVYLHGVGALTVDSDGALYAGDFSVILTTRAPFLSKKPEAQTANFGDRVILEVNSGWTNPTYQWSLNGTDLEGETASTLVRSSVSDADAGYYSVAVSYGTHTIRTDAVLLKVSHMLYNSAYSFSTYAGIAGMQGSMSGTDAHFKSPTYNCVDDSGNVYVVDNQTLRKITPEGFVTTLAGAPGQSGDADGVGSEARFQDPAGICADAAGNIFVSDEGNRTIRKVTPGGVVTTIAGAVGVQGSADGDRSTARFMSAKGLAIDKNSILYAADEGAGTVRKITLDGHVTTLAGTAGVFGNEDDTGAKAKFRNLIGIAVDANGVVYVTDAGNHSVRKISTSGHVSLFAQVGSADWTDSSRIEGICVGADGTVFVAEALSGAIIRISTTGISSTYAGDTTLYAVGYFDGPSNKAKFSSPWGVAIDKNGNVYVTDPIYAAVRKLPASGGVETLAGQPGYPGSNDSSRSATLFNLPLGITTDASGGVYVADSGNATLRKITADGKSTLIAGRIKQNYGLDPALQNILLPPAFGLALSKNGDLYFSTANQMIRKLTPKGTVSIVAGSGGAALRDGKGSEASFNMPFGLVLDAEENLYVADRDNFAIRKVTPAGVVSTLSVGKSVPRGIALDETGNLYVTSSNSIRTFRQDGSIEETPGDSNRQPGALDGPLSMAAFSSPSGLARAADGTIYIADTRNHCIRMLSTDGEVTTIGGLPDTPGASDGVGKMSRFNSPEDICLDAEGNLYVADSLNHTIRKGTPLAPTFSSLPVSVTHYNGERTQFSVTTNGAGKITYQWYHDGREIPGATQRDYIVENSNLSDAGHYTVRASNFVGAITSAPVSLNILRAPGTAHLSNVSIRAKTSADNAVVIVGVVVGGEGTSGSKTLLIRGAGPSLEPFGVAGFLADPMLTVYNGNTAIDSNDDWQATIELVNQTAALGAFTFPSLSHDAALLTTIGSGGYTTHLAGKAGSSGTGLVEAYDATSSDLFTPSTPRLINVSARAMVGTGDDILIAGFVIAGSGNRQLVIRAVGPGLTQFGVSQVLDNPFLELYNQAKEVVGQSDDWDTDTLAAQQLCGAFDIAAGSKDAVLVASLPAGPYTVQAKGTQQSTGIALIEVYEIP